jgi:hypothetical protein
VKLWDTTTGQERFTLRGHTSPVGTVAFNHTGTRLASASWDQTVKLWDTASGQEIHTLKGHSGPVVCVAFRPDGTLLASGGDDQTVKLWDMASGRVMRIFKGHTGTVRSIAFSPDGTQLASASEDRTLKLWDAVSGMELRTFTGHTGQVVSVAFSPDGSWLASASGDRTLKLWNAATGQELRTFSGHRSTVSSVTFGIDGTRLASASRDQTVKLWDTAAGQELRTLSGHTEAVWNVAFSPDGTRLASVSDDWTVVIWDARPLTPLVQVEVEAVGRLTYLSRKPLPSAEVRAAIQRDKLISAAVRQKALELADRFLEEADPKHYHDAAWPLIRHPYANVFMCEFALAQLRVACDKAPAQQPYRIALGIAQYRLGRFQKERHAEALATLLQSDQGHPATLAFAAMAAHQLGHQEKSRAGLARMREVLREEQWAKNPDARSFLREAAELIEGKPTQPRP